MLFDIFHPKRPAPLRVEDYLDDKNRELYDFVQGQLHLTVRRTTESVYGSYIIRDEATIYVPAGDPQPASFAHELLHAKMRIKEIFCSLKRDVSCHPFAKSILSDKLCEHISNIMEHRKMFPEFIAMGYKEEEFLADYHTPLLSPEQVSIIISSLKSNGHYLASGVDLFIGKYLSARFCCLSNYNYSKELQQMREAEPVLTAYLESFAERWDKFDIEKNDALAEDDCFLIKMDFVEDLDTWACAYLQ